MKRAIDKILQSWLHKHNTIGQGIQERELDIMAKPFITDQELKTITDYKAEMERFAAATTTTPRVATTFRKMLRVIDGLLLQKELADTVATQKEARKEAQKRQREARLKATIETLQNKASQGGKPK